MIFVPISGTYFLIKELNKNLFAFFLVFISFILFLKKIFLDRRGQFTIDNITLLVAVIVIYNSLRACFIENYDYTNLMPLWCFFFFYIFFLDTIREINNSKKVKNICLAVILFIVISQIFILIGQSLGFIDSNNRYFIATGIFDNPGPLAILLASTYVFVLILIYKSARNSFRFFLILCWSVSILYFLFILNSRAAIIGLVSSLVLLLVIELATHFQWNRKYRGVSVLLPVLILLVLTISLYFIRKDSAYGRVIIWKISQNIFFDNPFFGIGFNNFHKEYNLYQSDYFKNRPQNFLSEGYYVDYSKTALNEFIQVSCEQGIIGLVLSILLVALIIKSIKCNICTVSNSGGGAVLKIACAFSYFSIVIAGLFSDPLEHFPILMLSSFYIANIVQPQSDLLKLKYYSLNSFTINSKTLYAFSFVLLCVITSKTIVRHRALQKMFYVSNTSESHLLDRELISYDTYVIHRSKYLIKNGAVLECISFLEKAKKYLSNIEIYTTLGYAYRETKQYAKAEQNLLVASNMIPHLIYPKFLLAKIYLENNQLHKWRVMANHILSSKPKVESDEVQGMREEILWLLKSSK